MADSFRWIKQVPSVLCCLSDDHRVPAAPLTPLTPPWRPMCQAQRWQQALQGGLTAMRTESIEPNVISFCVDLGGRFGLWLPSGYVKIATEHGL